MVCVHLFHRSDICSSCVWKDWLRRSLCWGVRKFFLISLEAGERDEGHEYCKWGRKSLYSMEEGVIFVDHLTIFLHAITPVSNRLKEMQASHSINARVKLTVPHHLHACYLPGVGQTARDECVPQYQCSSVSACTILCLMPAEIASEYMSRRR